MSASWLTSWTLLPPRLVIHRLTGDPHPEELVAPEWCRDKSRVLTGIREELARRGSRQGAGLEEKSSRPRTTPLPASNTP